MSELRFLFMKKRYVYRCNLSIKQLQVLMSILGEEKDVKEISRDVGLGEDKVRKILAEFERLGLVSKRLI